MPLLFAYGTLQDAGVKQRIFGRMPDGEPDELPGFEISWHRAPQLADAHGKPHYLVIRFTGKPDSRISGAVYELSERELSLADAYETNAYRRILVRLASERDAWVYVAGE